MVGPMYVLYVHKNYSLDQRQTFAAKANDQKQDPTTFAAKANDQKQDPSPACQLLITSSPRINYYSQPNQNLPHQSRERAHPSPRNYGFHVDKCPHSNFCKTAVTFNTPILYYLTAHIRIIAARQWSSPLLLPLLAQLSPCTDPPLLSSLRRRREEP